MFREPDFGLRAEVFTLGTPDVLELEVGSDVNTVVGTLRRAVWGWTLKCWDVLEQEDSFAEVAPHFEREDLCSVWASGLEDEGALVGPVIDNTGDLGHFRL